MNRRRWIPLLTAMTGVGLMLSTARCLPAAQNSAAAAENDLRYYIHVSGIT